MYYIRYLKTPAYAPSGKGRGVIKALVTIMTDLGDDFCDSNIHLKTFLVTSGGEPCKPYLQALRWMSGMRQQWINLEIPSPQLPVSWRLVVTATTRPDFWQADNIDPVEHEVLTLISDPFDPFQQPKAGLSAERRFLLEKDYVLRIKEDTANSIARHIWDAGVVLVSCLVEIKRTLSFQKLAALSQVLQLSSRSPLNVLELGSGCGIVGIALAHLFPCNVTLTDLPDALVMLQANIGLATPMNGSRVQTLPLDWFDEAPSFLPNERLDLVVMADCTYNSDTIPSLVHTIFALCQEHPEALIVVSLKRRHASEAVFFELMSDAGLAQVDHLRLPSLCKTYPRKENDMGLLEIYTYRLTAGFSKPACNHQPPRAEA